MKTAPDPFLGACAMLVQLSKKVDFTAHVKGQDIEEVMAMPRISATSSGTEYYKG
jgi:hypothetical protein